MLRLARSELGSSCALQEAKESGTGDCWSYDELIQRIIDTATLSWVHRPGWAFFGAKRRRQPGAAASHLRPHQQSSQLHKQPPELPQHDALSTRHGPPDMSEGADNRDAQIAQLASLTGLDPEQASGSLQKPGEVVANLTNRPRAT